MVIEELNFSRDSFQDILAKDDRYHPYAYVFLSEIVNRLMEKSGGKHVSGEEVLEEFKEFALDQFGPLSYTVLTEWGVKACEDIGEMMFNLCDSGRIGRNEDDQPESFSGGYDFEETFLGPYRE